MARVMNLMAFYATFRLLKVAYRATERELRLIFVPKPGCEGAYEVDERIFSMVREITVNSVSLPTSAYPLNAADTGEEFWVGDRNYAGYVAVWLDGVDSRGLPVASAVKEVTFGEESAEYRFECGCRN